MANEKGEIIWQVYKARSIMCIKKRKIIWYKAR